LSATAWIATLLAPLFLGWLYLPYRQFRDQADWPIPGPSGWVALAAVVVLYGLMAWVEWTSPARLWQQQAADSAAAHRMLPAIWAVYGLPLWAAAIVCWPWALRNLLACCFSHAGNLPAEAYQALGWALMGFAWLVFGVFVMAA